MWEDIKGWVNSWKKSGTIIWARIQMVVGVALVTASATDMSPLIPAKYLPIWLVASGAITEIIRQRNSPDIRQ